MLTFTFLLFLVFGIALGQSPCGSPTTTTTTSTFYPVVMTYVPSMPVQVGPTSTIYDTIMTSYFNAIDCRFATPLLVDENPTPQGPFTTFVRSSVLVVTRIGCITETAAVTRREIQGQTHLEIRSAGIEQKHKIHKRRTAQEAVDEAINEVVSAYPPDATDLTVQAYRYMVSVNTALFAIHVIQAGIDLNQTCLHLREPATQARLFRTTIDPVQAGDIVCFAANNGIYFAAGIDAVVTYLEDLIYAIQVRSNYPDDSEDFCWPLLTEDSPFLGIDTNGIAQYLCPNGNVPGLSTTATAATSTSRPDSQGTGTIIPSSTRGPFGNTTTTTGIEGPTSVANSTTSVATVTPGPYANTTSTSDAANTTTPDAVTSVGTVGTIGTISTFSTLSDASTGIYPNTTSNTAAAGTGTGIGTGVGTGWGPGNLPPVPTSISPSIESVSSIPTRRMRRW